MLTKHFHPTQVCIFTTLKMGDGGADTYSVGIMVRVVFIWVSKSNWFCFNYTSTMIGLKNTRAPFHPIRRKSKPNFDSPAHLFPRFASALCKYVEFWLVHCIARALWDWLEWLLFCYRGTGTISMRVPRRISNNGYLRPYQRRVSCMSVPGSVGTYLDHCPPCLRVLQLPALCVRMALLKMELMLHLIN